MTTLSKPTNGSNADYANRIGLLFDAFNNGNYNFPATQVPSADPNTLDDFERGSCTLGASFGGAAVGITYGATSGRYVKLGESVRMSGLMRLTSKGSSVGAARITGLPFLVKNNANSYSPPSFQFGVMTFTGHPQGYADINTTTVQLTNIAAAGGAYSNLADTNFSNTTEVLMGLEYATTA